MLSNDEQVRNYIDSFIKSTDKRLLFKMDQKLGEEMEKGNRIER